MYTLPVYEIKAIGNVKGAMFAPNSDTESIPKDENPLAANEHKRVRVSKIANTEMSYKRWLNLREFYTLAQISLLLRST